MGPFDPLVAQDGCPTLGVLAASLQNFEGVPRLPPEQGPRHSGLNLQLYIFSDDQMYKTHSFLSILDEQSSSLKISHDGLRTS